MGQFVQDISRANRQRAGFGEHPGGFRQQIQGMQIVEQLPAMILFHHQYPLGILQQCFQGFFRQRTQQPDRDYPGRFTSRFQAPACLEGGSGGRPPGNEARFSGAPDLRPMLSRVRPASLSRRLSS